MKVQRNEEDWKALYNDFLASGVTAAAFCRERDISEASFSYRRRKYEGKFKKLTPAAPLPSRSVVIELPLGIQLKITC